MSYIAQPEGPVPSPLCLVFERPGWEEARAGRLGVGPAAGELWHRLGHAGAPDSSEWYCTALVKHFSDDVPTDREVMLGGAALRRELAEVQPKLVVGIGTAVARWLLGRDTNLDAVHGLVHYSKRTRCHVICIVHPSAALRQPAGFMSAFVDDCVAVARAANTLDTLTPHTVAAPDTTRTGRLRPEALVGCDTEGYVEAPECVSLSQRGRASVQVSGALTKNWDGYTLSFHNATHDLRVLEAMGVRVGEWHDTMLMAFLLDEHVQGLKPLAYRHCHLRLDDYDSLIAPLDDARVQAALQAYLSRHASALRRVERLKGKRKAEAKRAIPKAVGAVTRLLASPNDEPLRDRWSRSVFAPAVPLPTPTTWADLPPDMGAHYAKADAIAHEALCHALLPRLHEARLEQAYAIDKAALPMVARMETVGVQVDVPGLRALSEELAADYAATEQAIFEMLGQHLNPKASEDVSELLFGKLGITPTQLTKSGKYYTTQDKYLLARKREHGVIALILAGREAWKMKSTYTEKLPSLVSRDGRYHPDFAYTRTASGRLAERILLLIPKHSPKWGKKIRSCFTAAPGRVLVSVDLCLAPGTRVLRADLQWVPIEKIVEGDQLVAIDEHTRPGSSARCMRTAEAVRTGRRRAKCQRITFSNGKQIVASDEHPWLVRDKRRNNQGIWHWVKTRDLRKGHEFYLLAEPWARDDTRDAGWLAGVFDGEGSFDRDDATITFTQRKGIVMRMARRLLGERGYDFHKPTSRGGGYPGSRPVQQIWMCGLLDAMHFIGTIRPRRFLEHVERLWEGKQLRRHRTAKQTPIPHKAVFVTALESAGEQDVVSLETTTHTFVAEGFFTHNSQIEMRTMADNSGDEVLTQVFLTGGDVHADTAHRMLGAPAAKADQDDSLHRLPAKTLNFGVLMGMTQYGLLDQLHAHGQLHWQIDPCTDDERAAGKLSTVEFLATWFDGHAGVKAFVARKKREAKRTGYIRDMWGARVRLDAIDCTDDRRVREAERQAHAIPIQAGADRISKQWMARVWAEVCLPARGHYYCEPWCRAHDDLILEVDEGHADEVKAALLALVPQVLRVPVLADGKIGANWGALKG